MNQPNAYANTSLPQSEVYDAVTMFDLITRFAALMEIYSANTLNLTADWLEKPKRETEGHADAVRDNYIFTTAIDALRDAAESDDANNTRMERTPQAELEVLRVSLARVAQAAGVQVNSLQVLNASYAELLKLARSNARGWNLMAADIEATIKSLKAERIRARTHAVERISVYLSGGTNGQIDSAFSTAAELFNSGDAESHYFNAANDAFVIGNDSLSISHIAAVKLLLKQGAQDNG